MPNIWSDPSRIRRSRPPESRSKQAVWYPGLLAAMLFAVAGCSSFDVVNGLTPSGHYTSDRDIAYAEGPRQTLDIHVPEKGVSGAPVVVFFYGGGWREGSKDDYEFVASRLTDAGIIVVLPDYRLYPQVAFPDFIKDSALALGWVHNNISRYGGDPGRLFVAGHSAGAYIAAMLALDTQFIEDVGMKQGDIAGLIGLSGPYDFLPIESGYLLNVFPQVSRQDSQPVTFVDAGAPRTLLIHGTDDETVYAANSERLAARLRDAGVSVELHLYDEVGHARVVAAMAGPFDGLAPTAADIIAFIQNAARTADQVSDD